MKDELFLNNKVVTGLINSIENNGADLVFDETPLTIQSKAIGTDCMMKLANDSSTMIDLTKDYRTFVCNALVPSMRGIQRNINCSASGVSKSIGTNSKSRSSKSSGKSKTTMYDKLQSQYGFSDKEIDYLKKNFPNELSQLYATTFCGAGDSTEVYTEIQIELVKFNMKNTDGSWNMDALGNLINQDAEDISKVEYLAMCDIFDELSDPEKSEFIESAYTRTKVEEEHYSIGGGRGHYQYTISTGFQMLTSIYAANKLEDSELLFNDILNGNTSSSEYINAQKSYYNYNILYTYSFNASSIEGAKYDDKNPSWYGLPENDIDVIVMSAKDSNQNKITVSTIATYEMYAPTPSTAHSAVCNSAVFYGFPYMGDVTYGMTVTNNNYLNQLMPADTSDAGNATWAIIRDISTGAVTGYLDNFVTDAITGTAPVFVVTAGKYVPVVGTLVSIFTDIAEAQVSEMKEQMTIEVISNVQENNMMITNIGMLNISGTVIGCSDGTFYITNATYDKEEMAAAFAKYNETHTSKLSFNEDTFIHDLFNDEDYYNELKEADFFNYYAVFNSSYPE